MHSEAVRSDTTYGHKHFPAPIVLFVYKRPEHTRATLDALRMNTLADRSRLIVFSDGPESPADRAAVQAVRRIVKEVSGFANVEIVEAEKNAGLACSIIAGVTRVLHSAPHVIVLEDDLITSPHFLSYMNKALACYVEQQHVQSISGFNYPPTLVRFSGRSQRDVFLHCRGSSWGWATWADRWDRVDWNVRDFWRFFINPLSRHAFNRGGDDLTAMLLAQKLKKIDSWAIRWTYSHYRNSAYCLWPAYSYVDNIGHDATGTHCSSSERYANDLSLAINNSQMPLPIAFDRSISAQLRHAHYISIKTKIQRELKFAVTAFTYGAHVLMKRITGSDNPAS